MCRLVHWALLSVLVLGGLAAQPAPADVRKDEGKFFSSDAVEKANKRIAEMKEKTGVNLVVETFKEIPADKKGDYTPDRRRAFFATWAEDRAGVLDVKGVYILMCRSPGSFEVAVSKETENKGLFTRQNKSELALDLEKEFKADRFDNGLERAA